MKKVLFTIICMLSVGLVNLYAGARSAGFANPAVVNMSICNAESGLQILIFHRAGLQIQRNGGICCRIGKGLQFVCEKFGYKKKIVYLCIAFK